MFDDVLNWWQEIPAQVQTAIQTGGLLAVALLGGHFLGAMTGRALRAKNFDAAMRLPSASPAGAGEEHGITPTFLVSMLVRLTIWTGGVWWLAREHGRPDLAGTLELIVSRCWALAAVLCAALFLGRLLAQRLMDCVPPKTSAAGASSHRGAAGAVGAAAYVLVSLVVLLMAADVLGWPLTHSSALALWQLAHNLLVAGAALLIGLFGARWARELVSEGANSPEKRAGQYTALTIVAATTVLAVAVLLSSAGVLIGLAALLVLGVLVWLLRGYLPDVTAGLQLRAHQIREVWFEGAAWQVNEIGFLTTQVGRAGEFYRLPNRQVLEARFHGAPAEANSSAPDVTH